MKHDAIGAARCDHVMVMPKIDTIIRITYPREGLIQWKRIEDRAQRLIAQFGLEESKEAK